MNRADYMNRHVTHDEYYAAVADAIGRESLEQIVLARFGWSRLIEAFGTDPVLNNIPLGQWDMLDPYVRDRVAHRARAVMAVSWSRDAQPLQPGTYCWSLSETVCVMKAVARRLALESQQREHPL